MVNIFLDFDGPVVDLVDDESAEELTKKIELYCVSFYGLKINHAVTGKFFYRWSELRPQIVATGGNIRLFDQHMHAMIEEYEIARLNLLYPDPHTRELLVTLKSFFPRLAIISNNSQEAILFWLKKWSLHENVDFISARTPKMSFDLLKPNVYLIKQALRELKATPDKTLFVGDTFSDLTSARKCGVSFMGLITRNSSAGENIFLDPVLWRIKDKKLILKEVLSWAVATRRN